MTLTISQYTMKIGPDEARELLANGAPNRPVKKHHVARLAIDMRNGDWGQHGNPIVRDQNGRVIDGQHRLIAVIESGATIEFCFVDGVDAAMQDSMDTGARRSVGDQLAMRGEKNTNALASAITLAMVWEQNGKLVNFANYSHASVLRFFDQHPGLRDSTNFTIPFAKKIKYPQGLAGAMHYRMAQLSPNDADLFWNLLGTGRVIENSEVIANLRDKFQTSSKSDIAAMKKVYRAAVTIRAWNAWVTGTQLKHIKWAPQNGEKFPTLINPNDL